MGRFSRPLLERRCRRGRGGVGDEVHAGLRDVGTRSRSERSASAVARSDHRGPMNDHIDRRRPSEGRWSAFSRPADGACSRWPAARRQWRARRVLVGLEELVDDGRGGNDHGGRQRKPDSSDGARRRYRAAGGDAGDGRRARLHAAQLGQRPAGHARWPAADHARANPTTLDPHAGSSGNDYIMLYPIFDTLTRTSPRRSRRCRDWPSRGSSPIRRRSRSRSTAASRSTTARRSTPRREVQPRPGTHGSEVEHQGRPRPGHRRGRRRPDHDQAHLDRPDSEIVGILTDRGRHDRLADGGRRRSATASAPSPSAPDRSSWTTTRRVPRSPTARTPTTGERGCRTSMAWTCRSCRKPRRGSTALLSGETDFLYRLSAQAKDQVADADGLNVVQYVGIGDCSVIYFDTSNAPFDKKEVRQAFNMAVDREALVKAATFGTGEPMWMYFPASTGRTASSSCRRTSTTPPQRKRSCRPPASPTCRSRWSTSPMRTARATPRSSRRSSRRPA